MLDKVFSTIEKYNMIKNGDNIIVALSGGADSVALFHFLFQNKEKYNINLSVAHLNHGLRGAESDGDENFVCLLAKKYNVECFTKKVNMLTDTPPKKMGTEEWARLLRYEFLEDIANKKNAKIATAHSLSDNCETLLFHITRGTNIKGASGIAKIRQGIIRPLLEVTRSEIEEYCTSNKLDYVTDSTNLKDDYTRNKIRLNIMPILKKINSNVEVSMGRFINTQEEIDNYFNQKADKVLSESKIAKDKYNKYIILSQDTIIIKYIIAKLVKQKGQVDSKKVDLILNLLQKDSSAVEITTNERLIINKDTIYFKTQYKDINIEEKPLIDGKNLFYDGFNIYIEKISKKSCVNFEKFNKNSFKYMGDYDKIIGQAVLRGRKTGDEYEIPKRNCTKSLKKFFIEEKIPQEQRAKIPVLAIDNKIIWVNGYGFIKEYQVNEETENILIIKD